MVRPIVGILLGIALSCTSAVALPEMMPDSVVERIPQEFSLRAGPQAVSLVLRRRSDGARCIPNNPLRLSIGVVYGELGLGGSVSLPYTTKDDRSASSALDLQMHRFTSHWIADLYLQHYQGFLLKGREAGRVEDPSLVAYQVGGMLQRVVLGQGLAYRSAFRHDYRQVRSCGILTIGAAAYLTGAASDSVEIAGRRKNLSSFQFGPCLGYAWSAVPQRDWLLLISGTGGYYAGTGGLDRDPFAHGASFHPAGTLRFSLSRDIGAWSLGGAFLGSEVSLRGPDGGFLLQAMRTDLYAVRRFGG